MLLSCSCITLEMLKNCTRFPRTWLIRSNTVLDMGFSEVLDLAVIPYSVLIRHFLNSRPINSYPWSYMISIGLGYLDSHVVSTKFVIYIALLSSYCVISNHPVTGSILVTAFIFIFYFCPFLCMVWRPIISTQSLFRGISSASLAGNLPYFIFYCHIRWQVSPLVISFRKASRMPGQYKYWQIIASGLSVPGLLRHY